MPFGAVASNVSMVFVLSYDISDLEFSVRPIDNLFSKLKEGVASGLFGATADVTIVVEASAIFISVDVVDTCLVCWGNDMVDVLAVFTDWFIDDIMDRSCCDTLAIFDVISFGCDNGDNCGIIETSL